MSLVVRVVAHGLFALTIIVAIGLWFLVIPIFAGTLGANPVENLLHRSGEIAIWTLFVVLTLTPLRVLFPHSRLVNALNRHRRTIGVSACVYGLLHFGCHVLYEGNWDSLVESFTKPFVWFGLGGLIILVILALTSNQWAIRALGGKNWKRLHRLAYLAAALLIYHQAIAGKGHWHVARWLFFSLVALELARILKSTLLRERPRARLPAGSP